jgi:hypothetical protein
MLDIGGTMAKTPEGFAKICQAQEIREFGVNLDPILQNDSMYKNNDRIVPHHPRVSSRIILNNASVMANSVPMVYYLVAILAI